MKRLLQILFCLVLACPLVAGRAEAHASLIEASPADGAVVATAPPAIRLRFNEPTSLLVVRLIDAAGTTHADFHHEARDQTITVHLPKGLPNGTQVLSYRVVSSDGHPIGGSLMFSIGAPSVASAPRATGRMSPFTSPLAGTIWLSRLILYTGLFAGAGGAFFAAWIGRDATTRAGRRVVEGAIGIGITTSVLSVGLQGLDALGEGFPALLSPHPWHAGIKTSFGISAITAIAALLFALAAMRSRASSAALALAGLGGTGLALALSGHASAASPQWLTRPSIFVHGAAAAFWVGALVPLALIVRDRRGAALPIVHRFSALAVPAVGVLALAGLALSIVQLETPAALLTTDYGRVFLVKMAAVLCLLGLAALNRMRLTPMLASKDAGSRLMLRSILGEIVLAIIILGAVAAWRFTPPPRALATPDPAPATIHIHTPAAMVEMSLAPGRVGPVTVTLSLATGDFETLNAKEVTVMLAKPDAGIEPMERRAIRTPEGDWRAQGLVLPVPGPWQARVDVLISDFEKATLEGTVEIRP